MIRKVATALVAWIQTWNMMFDTIDGRMDLIDRT
jgi:hypothetical protein